MNEEFSVKIANYCEGVEYRDEQGSFRFELGLKGSDFVLHAYDYRERTLSEEQRLHIIPRIVDYLGRHGKQVEILWERPPQTLRSVDDILRERFRS